MVFIVTTHEYEVGIDKKLIRENRIAFTINLDNICCRNFPCVCNFLIRLLYNSWKSAINHASNFPHFTITWRQYEDRQTIMGEEYSLDNKAP